MGARKPRRFLSVSQAQAKHSRWPTSPSRLEKPTSSSATTTFPAAQLYSEFKGFFPNNSGAVFCLLLRLPSAGGLYTHCRQIHRKRSHDQRRDRKTATVDRLGTPASGRVDVVVVSFSVMPSTCMGNPEDFDSNVVTVKVGQKNHTQQLLRSLVNSLYFRATSWNLSRGTFRCQRRHQALTFGSLMKKLLCASPYGAMRSSRSRPSTRLTMSQFRHLTRHIPDLPRQSLCHIARTHGLGNRSDRT